MLRSVAVSNVDKKTTIAVMDTNPWIHIYDALPHCLVNQARQACNDGMFHSGALLCSGLHGRRPVNVLVGDVVPEGLGIGDQTFCRVWRDGLSTLVVAYIALRATHASGKRFLSDAEFFSDGFNSAHFRIVAALLNFVNSGTVLLYETAALLSKHEKSP